MNMIRSKPSYSIDITNIICHMINQSTSRMNKQPVSHFNERLISPFTRINSFLSNKQSMSHAHQSMSESLISQQITQTINQTIDLAARSVHALQKFDTIVAANPGIIQTMNQDIILDPDPCLQLTTNHQSKSHRNRRSYNPILSCSLRE